MNKNIVAHRAFRRERLFCRRVIRRGHGFDGRVRLGVVGCVLFCRLFRRSFLRERGHQARKRFKNPE